MYYTEQIKSLAKASITKRGESFFIQGSKTLKNSAGRRCKAAQTQYFESLEYL